MWGYTYILNVSSFSGGPASTTLFRDTHTHADTRTHAHTHRIMLELAPHFEKCSLLFIC